MSLEYLEPIEYGTELQGTVWAIEGIFPEADSEEQ